MSPHFRMFLLALGLLGLVVGMLTRTAHAADANVTWEHPTTWDDDTPLAVTDITETVVEWGRCTPESEFPPQPEGSTRVAGPAASVVVPGLRANVLWCFRAATVADGQTSDWSDTATGIWLRKPRPPKLTGPVAGSMSVVIQ